MAEPTERDSCTDADAAPSIADGDWDCIVISSPTPFDTVPPPWRACQKRRALRRSPTFKAASQPPSRTGRVQASTALAMAKSAMVEKAAEKLP
jgi:hypothetical protein